MRKMAIVTLLGFMVLACATAQPVNLILYKNSPTFQWDAITTGVDGQPLLPADQVSYEVYAYDWQAGVASDQDPALLVSMGTASATELVLHFPHRSYWAVGVRARVLQADGQVYLSTRIAWSNRAEDTKSGVPFLFAPLLGGVQAVKGLRDSGM